MFFIFFFISNDNNLFLYIGCECVNVDFNLENFNYYEFFECYYYIVFEIKYNLNEEDK